MWTPATRGRMAKIEKKTKRYPSVLTDEEWARVEPFLPRASKAGRPIEVDLRIAFNTSRKSTSIGRPAFDARGRKGSTRAHSSSVKSLGYRLVFFSILAIRPRVAGVHIPSLNHGRKPHSTTCQTDSNSSASEVPCRTRWPLEFVLVALAPAP